jgi:hypothetical protein
VAKPATLFFFGRSLCICRGMACHARRKYLAACLPSNDISSRVIRFAFGLAAP